MQTKMQVWLALMLSSGLVMEVGIGIVIGIVQGFGVGGRPAGAVAVAGVQGPERYAGGARGA